MNFYFYRDFFLKFTKNCTNFDAFSHKKVFTTNEGKNFIFKNNLLFLVAFMENQLYKSFLIVEVMNPY